MAHPDIENYFLANNLIDKPGLALENRAFFPLYFSEDPHSKQTIENRIQTGNLNFEIVNKIANQTGLEFTNRNEEQLHENSSPVCYALSSELRDEFRIPVPRSTFSPTDILDYIYAILHSSSYGKKHPEFLKKNFVRVSYPKTPAEFWKSAQIGGEIRQIHFLKSPKPIQPITTYPEQGNNIITRKLTGSSPGFVLTVKENALGRIWINDRQYFDKVPRIAWEFYIGGYQPAREWLKARKGNTLGLEDILHYQKMIFVLCETSQLIKRIDEIEI